MTASRPFVKFLINDMNDDHDDFRERIIAEMAQFFEDLGASATLGRMFGLLLTSAGPLSLEALAGELNISKAAVSVQIRRLEELRYCRRIPRGSDRKQYFELNPDYLVDNLSLRVQVQEQWLDRLREIRAGERERGGSMEGEGLPLRRLDELIRFQRDMQQGYRDLMRRFQEETQEDQPHERD